MVMTRTRRDEILKGFARKEGDTGSPEVQVALLTERIKQMTGHMQVHKKDYHSRLGLTKMVARRNRLLTYLRREDADRYKALIESLGLRK